MSEWRIITGDVLDGLRSLPDGCAQTCVTSPPYWGLRDYGVDGQIGLEATPAEYLSKMVEVFREVRRVLRDDGTAWVNMGDGYASCADSGGPGKQDSAYRASGLPDKCAGGFKPKDLIGMPWRLAFALQADGWWLRSDIIWSKPNPMPESVMDRPTKAHEYIFLLAKSARYYFDTEAVKEDIAEATRNDAIDGHLRRREGQMGGADKGNGRLAGADPDSRNIRTVLSLSRAEWLAIYDKAEAEGDVWKIATQPYAEAHFATYPEKLIKPCVLAGCPEGGTVLDPFTGSGTTAVVALRHGRSFIGCELNPEYVRLAERRIGASLNPATYRDESHVKDAPLFINGEGAK